MSIVENLDVVLCDNKHIHILTHSMSWTCHVDWPVTDTNAI